MAISFTDTDPVATPPKRGIVFTDVPAPGQLSNPDIAQPDGETMLRQKEAIGVRRAVAKERQKFIDDNTQGGVRISLDEGLPAGLRSTLSFESNLDKQIDRISKQPGIIAVRKSKDGDNALIRVQGEDGKPKEILLHPKGPLTPGDIAGATAPLLKTAGATAAAVATGGASLPVTSGVLGLTGAGMEALSSGGSRLLSGQDIDPKDLALRSAKAGAIDAALPVAGEVLKQTARGSGVLAEKLFSRGAGKLEQEAVLAAERQGLPLTPSMETGSGILARAENTAGTKEFERQQAGALAASKDRQIGPSGTQQVLAESDIAAKAQPILAAEAQQAQRGVATALTDAQKAANAQIQAQLDAGLIPSFGTTQTQAGGFIRGKLDEAVKAFRAQAQKNYGELYRLADEEGLSIPTKEVTNLAKEIAEKDPQGALEQIVPGIKRIFSLEGALTAPRVPAQATGLVDELGRPIMTKEVAARVTLPQAIELRAVINESIDRGEAIGDIPGRYLKDLSESLTEAIEQGVKGGSDDLQKAFDVARANYARDIQKFSPADIARIFKDPETAAALGDDEIVPALFRGRGNLDALRKLKEALGPNSADYKFLLRQGLQSIVDDARAGAELVDAGKFLSRLGSLSPELQEEALGAAAKNIKASATLLQRAQGTKIPEEELIDAMTASKGTKAAQLLDQAIVREQATDQAYNSSMQRQLRDGVLGPRTLGSVDTFVSRFVDKASAQDVRQALTQIGSKSPEVVEQIRQRALLNVLEASGAKPAVGQATTGEAQKLAFDKLLDFTKGANREKYQAILGKDGMQFLDDLATYAEADAKRLSQIQSGSELSKRVFMKEALSGGAGFVRNAIGTAVDAATFLPRYGVGKAALSPAVQRFLETGQLPSLGRNVRTAILAAPEAIQAGEAVLAEKP